MTITAVIVFIVNMLFFTRLLKTKQHVHDSNLMKQEWCHDNLTSYLRGGMDTDTALSCTHQMRWNRLSQRLAQIGLIPFDVGGDGDCFSSLFLINFMELQTFILAFAWLDLVIYIVTQNVLLSHCVKVVGQTILSKYRNLGLGVITLLYKRLLMLLTV